MFQVPEGPLNYSSNRTWREGEIERLVDAGKSDTGKWFDPLPEGLEQPSQARARKRREESQRLKDELAQKAAETEERLTELDREDERDRQVLRTADRKRTRTEAFDDEMCNKWDDTDN